MLINFNTAGFSKQNNKPNNAQALPLRNALPNNALLSNEQPLPQVNFRGLLNSIFKKKPPLEELQELATLAHSNPRPLYLMVIHGELAGLEDGAIKILKKELAKVDPNYENIVHGFERPINILETKDYHKAD